MSIDRLSNDRLNEIRQAVSGLPFVDARALLAHIDAQDAVIDAAARAGAARYAVSSQRVMDLHKRDGEYPDDCTECRRMYCPTFSRAYPCATIRALDGKQA